MHYAARQGNLAIVRALLSTKGINANAQSKRGWTALMYAVKQKHINVVKLLCTKPGLDLNLLNDNCNSAFNYCKIDSKDKVEREIYQVLCVKNRYSPTAKRKRANSPYYNYYL